MLLRRLIQTIVYFVDVEVVRTLYLHLQEGLFSYVAKLFFYWIKLIFIESKQLILIYYFWVLLFFHHFSQIHKPFWIDEAEVKVRKVEYYFTFIYLKYRESVFTSHTLNKGIEESLRLSRTSYLSVFVRAKCELTSRIKYFPTRQPSYIFRKKASFERVRHSDGESVTTADECSKYENNTCKRK